MFRRVKEPVVVRDIKTEARCAGQLISFATDSDRHEKDDPEPEPDAARRRFHLYLFRPRRRLHRRRDLYRRIADHWLRRPAPGFLMEPGQPRRRFQVMAKPGGAACNLRCRYCYYLPKAELLDQGPHPRMSDERLEIFIRQYIEGNQSDEVVFSWQGGEPTLLGLGFFQKAVDIQKRHAPRGRSVANTLQTNGTLLTGDWAAFLKENNFLVGLSVDGPEELHDLYRRDQAGQPTFRRVMAGLEHLKRHGVAFTTLCTVNRRNAKKPLEVYRFLTRELGSTYVQFNPCVEPLDFEKTAPDFRAGEAMPLVGSPRSRPGPDSSVVTEWSVDPRDWGDFLSAIFDEWLERDLGRVLVNWFETAVAQTMGLPAQICPSGEICGKGLALEHDGRVYSCDHYVYPEYCLGNIEERELAGMAFSSRQRTFAFKKRDSLPQYCLKCSHGLLCWGQCPRHRLLKTPSGEPGLNYLCPGFKKFFSHAKPALRSIAARCLADSP